MNENMEIVLGLMLLEIETTKAMAPILEAAKKGDAAAALAPEALWLLGAQEVLNAIATCPTKGHDAGVERFRSGLSNVRFQSQVYFMELGQE